MTNIEYGNHLGNGSLWFKKVKASKYQMDLVAHFYSY